MCLPEYFTMYFRSACVLAEPVVSACVLEGSLEIYSKYTGGCITAAAFFDWDEKAVDSNFFLI